MAVDRRTYRVVDGEQIEGTWRPIFLRNGDTYLLTDLLIYADGALYCGDWTDLDGLRARLASGRVATHLEPRADVVALHLASWRFRRPRSVLTAERLLGEVADQIDHLNGRPDSTGRCLQALDRYLETRSADDRRALRKAHRAVPEHRRLYALGDMDRKDHPLRVLCTEVGERTTHDEPVTEQMHAEAFAYFAGRERSVRQGRDDSPVDGPDQAHDPTVKLASIPGHWPAEPAHEWLRNEYPAPIEIGGTTYATAVHAYWSLATTDDRARAAIRDTAVAVGVQGALGGAPLREDWPHVRLAVMHAILRAKFAQHPAIADVLVGTGDARIDHSVSSPYWSGGTKGRNWLGRLLEVVRSEIVAERAGAVP